MNNNASSAEHNILDREPRELTPTSPGIPNWWTTP